MTQRRITDSFNVFGARKPTENERKKVVQQIRRAISVPMVRERIMLAEMYGYFEKRPLTDDPENPPAFRTVKIAISDDGTITHTEEIFNTPTGDQVDAMEHSGVGGWSWARVDGSGRPDFRYFTGFDYKRYPNISKAIGRSISFFEGAPDLLLGDETQTVTGKGDKVAARWAILDVRDLVMSNAPDGTINPEFPPELQPRDRTSLKSKLQVLDVSREMDFDRLTKGEYSGAGAPIIGPDRVVESGNGRTMGILRAYASGTADNYRANVIAAAEGLGLPEDATARIEFPALVRLRTGEVDRVQFAIDSNIKPGETKMFEQAMMEAAKGKKGDRRELFKQAGNVADVQAIIKMLIPGGLAWMNDEGISEYVGMLMRKLRTGQITREAYLEQIRSLLGKTWTSANKVLRVGMFGSQISKTLGVYGGPLSYKDVFMAVVMEGRTWDIGKAWKEWAIARQGKDEARKREAGRGVLEAVEPLLTTTAKGTTNFVEGGWSWFLARASIASGDFTWEWYNIAGKWVDVNFQDKQASIDNYKAIRQRGIADIPDFHKTVDRTLDAMRAFWDQEQWKDVLRSSDIPFTVQRRLKIMFEHTMLAPTPAGNDGWSTLKGYLDQSWVGDNKLQLAVEECFSNTTYLCNLAAYQLKEHHAMDEATSLALAGAINIDPKLEEKHGKYMGEGRLREWIAECFQMIGGCPRSLKNFYFTNKSDKGRACATGLGQQIRITEKESKKTVWHEIGHHYEFSTPGAIEAAQGYLLSRASTFGNNQLIALKGYVHDGYGDHEVCILDNLSQPYTGKVYGNGLDSLTSTEVFSIGLEYLSGQSGGGVSLANMDGLVEFVYAFIKENPIP